MARALKVKTLTPLQLANLRGLTQSNQDPDLEAAPQWEFKKGAKARVKKYREHILGAKVAAWVGGGIGEVLEVGVVYRLFEGKESDGHIATKVKIAYQNALGNSASMNWWLDSVQFLRQFSVEEMLLDKHRSIRALGKKLMKENSAAV